MKRERSKRFNFITCELPKKMNVQVNENELLKVRLFETLEYWLSVLFFIKN